MRWRTACLLILVFLLQTALGLLFRYFEPTEYIRLLATQGIVLFLPAAIYLLLYRMPTVLAQGRGITFLNVLFSVILMLCTSIISQFINAPVIQLFADHSSTEIFELQTPHTAFEFLLALVFICIIPAVVEEFLFRGIVLRDYINIYGARRAILLTTAIYTILHFDLPACLPQLFIGLVTGVLVYRTGSLFCGMVAHFSNNLLGLMMQMHTDWFAELLTVHTIWVIIGACCILCIIGRGLFLYNPRHERKYCKNE